MKLKVTIAVVAFGTLGLFQAMAQSTSTSQSASATLTEKTSFAREMPKMVTPLNLPQTKETTSIRHVGGMSSQSWAQIAEREQDRQGFPNSETPEPKFDLLSVNWSARH